MQLNFNDICSNFYEHKELIINLFAEYYGEEYKDLIKDRIEKTYYNFSSSPDYDYFYMLKNMENMKRKDIALIKLKNKKYQLICNHIDKKIKKELLSFIDKKIEFDAEKIDNQKEFLTLFTDEDYNQSLIDCYSLKVNELLQSKRLQKSLEKNIIDDRQKVKAMFSKYDIDIEKVNENTIDEIISFRNNLRKKRLNYIATHSDFGYQIFRSFEKNYGLDLPEDILSFIAFIQNAYSGALQLEKDNEESEFYQYVRIPITYLYSKEIKGFDVNIIHELIHKIETNKNITGIILESSDFENSILNEIRTQKLAIKLTKQLHDMNIFIYDDPKNSKIIGESDYEYFFPLVGEFIEKHESMLSNCAINNDSDSLIDVFGSSFIDFYNRINEIFYDSNQYISKDGEFRVTRDNKIDTLINKMENHFQKQNTKVKKYKK